MLITSAIGLTTTAQLSYFRRRQESIAREFRDDSPGTQSGLDEMTSTSLPLMRIKRPSPISRHVLSEGVHRSL